MYDTEIQARFARKYADAMVGYMTATTAASSALMGQLVDVWAAAARTASGLPANGSGPATRSSPYSSMLPVEAFAPWGSVSGVVPPWTALHSTPFDTLTPFDLWLSMTPFGRSPVVLQMAWAMMTLGVPRSVAMPTAEANMAALEAAETAVAPIREAYAAYRSDGGHASSQIISLNKLVAAVTLTPLGAAALGPWLHVPRPYGL